FEVVATGRETLPTAEAVLEALDRLAEQARPDDLAIIMLAGHGGVDAGGGFVFYAYDRAVTQNELNERFHQLKCRALLLLDTCHAGAAAGIEAQLKDFSKVLVGPQVLTACDSDQTAEEYSPLGHGLFTTALLEALQAEFEVPQRFRPAQPIPRDANGDGLLSIDELCRYVQLRTPKLADMISGIEDAQTPQVHPSLTFYDSRSFPIGRIAPPAP
ncbi:MAG: caspase family protein, partial [Planctomycetaceae bacterium]